MKLAVAAGLLTAGSECFDAGIVPTPTLGMVTRNFDAGLMVTASHNPPQYNGIKLLNPDGSAFNQKQRNGIEKAVLENRIIPTHWEEFKNIHNYRKAIKEHVGSILTSFPDKYNIRVVLDCGGAAASLVTPQLLKAMGCEVIQLNCKPVGIFPRGIEPNEKNIFELIKMVKVSGAALGLAHDGDADRMTAVDDKGRFINGDKLMLIMAKELKIKKLITTIDASMVVDEAGFEVIRTRVGDNNVSEELINGGEMGGEPSGSWIFPQNSLCPDGIYAAAVMVSIASRNKISNLVDKIPSYFLIRGDTNNNGIDMKKLKEIMLNKFDLLSIDEIDGIKINVEGGWILVRKSGTEPKLRVTVEAKTREIANYFYEKSIEFIENL
jgi:phosphoglucosamine mutase